jgi:uncharacterized protein YbjT (DUF2867 family)
VGVRAFVRRRDQEDPVLELGAAQVVFGDLANRAAIRRAVDGVEAIYHICPNVDPLEVEYANLLIDAAIDAGLEHFGYHSVLHPQTERMAHHWRKLRVEESLFESGLTFTIMQPCAYMQNLLGQIESISDRGIIEVPYSTKAKLSLVDLQDVAQAIAVVMSEPGHSGAIYELAGPEPLDHEQIATVLGMLLGQPVRAQQLDLGEWSKHARQSGMGEYQRGALHAMFAYYDRFGFQGNPNVLTYLLGRKANTLDDFLRRTIAQ